MRNILPIVTLAAGLAIAAAQDTQPATPTPEPPTTEEASPADSSSEEPTPGGQEAQPNEKSPEAPAPGQSTTPEPAESAESPAAAAGTEEDVISLDNMPELALPDDSLVDPSALVPDMPPPAPVNPESIVQRQRELTIKYREARVKFEQDPAVVALREKADRARSAEARRAALREYYRLLLKKIAASDNSLADKCKQMEEAYLRRLAQTRIEPTIPLGPPPTPEPLD